jgi:hypothetical protein
LGAGEGRKCVRGGKREGEMIPGLEGEERIK